MSERARMEYENEEKERQDLKRMIHGDTTKSDVSKIGEDLAASASKISGVTANQKLKIYRTIKNPDGSESARVEVVTRPQLIEAYTRIRMTKDETFIQVYAQMDEQYKERAAEKKPTPIKPNLLKMRCSACHGTGHMKTNKNCPLYGKDPLKTPTKDGTGSGVSDVDEDSIQLSGELIAVEGTKVKINRKLYMNSQDMLMKKTTKSSLPRHMIEERSRDDSVCSSDAGEGPSPPMLIKAEDDDDFSDIEPSTSRGPRMVAGSGVSGKRRISTLNEEDYLQGPMKSIQRVRADPRVTMGTLLTEIVTELKSISGSEHLLFAVNAKKVRDYYDIVTDPMDLQKIKNKIADNKYELRQDFLGDVKKMLDNSRLYNGDNHVITEAARKVNNFQLTFLLSTGGNSIIF
uniref:Bromo domain-containing protein n=1 Tax=Heterorhabditis bacteriophora TaxID=37862 RepID=A0A1I7XMT1_HETBA